MDRTLFRTIRAVAFALFFASLAASGQPPQMTTVSLQSDRSPALIVAVKINHMGPFDFIVDTGSTSTIIDSALFAQTGIAPTGTVTLKFITGDGQATLGTAREIAIEDVCLQNVEVIAEKKLSVSDLYRHVRGILGENFLEHFDLLIDNQHKRITLDEGSNLANTLAGEHLPMSSFTMFNGRANPHRHVVTVTLPAYDHKSLKLLLDSGANSVLLFPSSIDEFQKAGHHEQPIQINGSDSSLFCSVWQDRVLVGSTTLSEVNMQTCAGSTANKTDSQGLLPTLFFKQIFISHLGSYIIANPTQRPARPEPPSLQQAAR